MTAAPLIETPETERLIPYHDGEITFYASKAAFDAVGGPGYDAIEYDGGVIDPDEVYMCAECGEYIMPQQELDHTDDGDLVHADCLSGYEMNLRASYEAADRAYDERDM